MGSFESPNDYRNYLMHYGVRGMRWRNRPSRDVQDPDWLGMRRRGRGHTAQENGTGWERFTRGFNNQIRRATAEARGGKSRAKNVRNSRNKNLDVLTSGRRDIHPLTHELLRRKQNRKHR